VVFLLVGSILCVDGWIECTVGIFSAGGRFWAKKWEQPQEVCCVGPVAIAAFWGSVRSFGTFGDRVASRALHASRWMPAVPGIMAKALAREALGWANGLIGFDGNSDTKQTI